MQTEKSKKPRAGAQSIFIDPAVAERIDRVRASIGIETKAQFARLGLTWALEKLESGELVVMNGKLVPKPHAEPVFGAAAMLA